MYNVIIDLQDGWKSTISRPKEWHVFSWHLLPAFIRLSIEDFYQISANEFIDSIKLGKFEDTHQSPWK